MNHLFHLNKESLSRLTGFDAAKERAQAEEAAAAREFSVVTRTDIGLVRRSNQDAVIEAGPLVGVADGMGGHMGGETASADASSALIAALEGRTPSAQALGEGFRAANAAVHAHAAEDPALYNMGTTLCVTWLGEKEVYVGHCGDSRCYRFDGETLLQVTDDHSMVMEMVRAGALTKEQAACHPMRNVIPAPWGPKPRWRRTC